MTAGASGRVALLERTRHLSTTIYYARGERPVTIIIAALTQALAWPVLALVDGPGWGLLFAAASIPVGVGLWIGTVVALPITLFVCLGYSWVAATDPGRWQDRAATWLCAALIVGCLTLTRSGRRWFFRRRAI